MINKIIQKKYITDQDVHIVVVKIHIIESTTVI